MCHEFPWSYAHSHQILNTNQKVNILQWMHLTCLCVLGLKSPNNCNICRAYLLGPSNTIHASAINKSSEVKLIILVLWGCHKDSNGEGSHFEHMPTHRVLHMGFVYRADRLVPCSMIIYTVTSTSPQRGLSALELLIRSQLWLRVYSTIESPKYFKAKLTRYCSYSGLKNCLNVWLFCKD